MTTALEISRRPSRTIAGGLLSTPSIALVRRRPPLGLPTCLVICTIAVLLVLRFAWSAVLMAFVMLGVTSPGTMAAVVIGVVVVGAIALRERIAGRPF